MASSRDDFIIAIRSAFLKKSTQQKFSLLTLVFISIFIIARSLILSTANVFDANSIPLYIALTWVQPSIT